MGGEYEARQGGVSSYGSIPIGAILTVEVCATLKMAQKHFPSHHSGFLHEKLAFGLDTGVAVSSDTIGQGIVISKAER